MGSTEKFCLRWNDFESNISGAFRELREDKDFFDVTLACDDDQLQAHKLILSACSPFFRTILRRNKHEHPLLYLKGVKYADLVSVLNFMYQGEVNVAQEELHSFLAVAEDLKVKGLTQTNSDHKKPVNPQHSGSTKPSNETDPLPTPKCQRPAPPPAPRAAPPSYHPDVDDIQEVVPVKSEPVPLPPDTQTHSLTHMAQVEQTYSTPQVDQMATGVVADPKMEYVGYEGADGTYEGGVLDASGMDMGGQDGKKELDDLILSNMMKTKNEFGKPEWQCKVCGKKGVHKRSLMVHVESHMDLVEQQCPYCEKRPRTRDALRVHIKNYHKK